MYSKVLHFPSFQLCLFDITGGNKRRHQLRSTFPSHFLAFRMHCFPSFSPPHNSPLSYLQQFPSSPPPPPFTPLPLPTNQHLFHHLTVTFSLFHTPLLPILLITPYRPTSSFVPFPSSTPFTQSTPLCPCTSPSYILTLSLLKTIHSILLPPSFHCSPFLLPLLLNMCPRLERKGKDLEGGGGSAWESEWRQMWLKCIVQLSGVTSYLVGVWRQVGDCGKWMSGWSWVGGK